MYSHSYLTLICNPSRITSHSATFIDHIFTNDLFNINKIKSGLLIDDVSYHLPIFSIVCDDNDDISSENIVHFRKMRYCGIINLKNDLFSYNWESIIGNSNADDAYDTFMFHFDTALDSHCQIVTKQTDLISNSKPWFTAGLKSACKKSSIYTRNYS